MMTEKDGYDPNSLPDLLPIYYKRLFPYGPYFRWLNYGGVPKTYFSYREFSFTLKDEIYIRYQSFSDQAELEKEIQKKCPYKIDIGAVFSFRPKDRLTVKAEAFRAEEKELVFDIDMTDYDDVRACCSGADICPQCWTLMTIAIKVIDRALRDDFGFEHLLWVYSGRRGVHCWVCDETARKLSQNGRSAIAEYLSVVKGGENQIKKVTLPENGVHPSIQEALNIVNKHFTEYAVEKQDFMGDEEKTKKVLALIPDESARSQMSTYFDKTSADTSKKKWLVLRQSIQNFRNQGQYSKCYRVDDDIMLQYAYPRLDVNVSKGVNHLLKSPFCVHPKTGRVCIPIDPANADKFNPFTVPTISQLCEELNQVEKPDDSGKRKTKDYRQTSMGEGMEVFEEFLKKLEMSWRGKKIEQSDVKKEF